MGRKKSEAIVESHELTKEQTPGIERAAEAANQMALMQHQYNEDRDLINQLIGQIQMTDAISKLTTVVGLTKMAHIKEGKLYRALAGKTGVDRDGSEITDVGCWAGFCRAIGSSQQKVDEDLLNLRTFGEEAMDNLTRIGAGYRELRQLRKLPEDQQTALLEVARLGDKESFVELAEEIIAKHTKEKEALTKELTEANANAEANDQVISDKNRKLDELDKKLRRKEVELTPWDERVGDLNSECSMVALGVEELLEKYWLILQALTNAQFDNDVQDRARAALAKNFFDRTQRIVERVAFIQAKMYEEFDGYINEPKYLMPAPADVSNQG